MYYNARFKEVYKVDIIYTRSVIYYEVYRLLYFISITHLLYIIELTSNIYIYYPEYR